MPEQQKVETILLDKSDSQDAAWAILHTPLNVEELKLFCQDIERLFRINPMLNFSTWQKIDRDRYYCTGQNLSQQPPFNFELTLVAKQLPDGIQIDYEQGLKTRTTFIIAPVSNLHTQPTVQTKLIITDYYDGLPEETRIMQLHHVDKSITAWANDLQRYLISWHKWSHHTWWRWYMHRIWQPLRPMGRRIVSILLWITAFELALIVLGTTIYYIEYMT